MNAEEALRSFNGRVGELEGTYRLNYGFGEDPRVSAYEEQGLSFVDVVQRTEGLLGRVPGIFIGRVIGRMRDGPDYFEAGDSLSDFPEKGRRETNARILEGAEAIADADLPEEVFIAFASSYHRKSFNIGDFSDRITQDRVIERLHELDASYTGPEGVLVKGVRGVGVIGYAAVGNTKEDVVYVAENIEAPAVLGKLRPVWSRLISENKINRGIIKERLRAFLPEDIELRKLPKLGKRAVRDVGFTVPLNHIDLVHGILRDNVEALYGMTERRLGRVPGKGFGRRGNIVGLMHKFTPAENVREAYVEWLE